MGLGFKGLEQGYQYGRGGAYDVQDERRGCR